MDVLHRLRNKAQPVARVGCVAIGTVYVVVGTLALLALSGQLIEAADEDRMIPVLMEVPGGVFLIWTMIVGIVGYVVWRAVEVITDPYDFGTSMRGLATRALIALTAVAYGLLAVSAARLAITHGESTGAGRDGAEEEQQRLIAHVFDWPGGVWIVGAAGAALIAVGIGQFVVLFRRAYTTEVDLPRESPRLCTTIHTLAWYGYSARGVILTLLGYFLVRAAVGRNPAEAGDTDTAFDFIGGGAVGDSAFFVVALGTIAYGVFMYLNAWFYCFGGRQRDDDLPQPR